MLDLTNVITVNVSQAPTGLGAYNVNNVALFTDETPIVAQGDYSVYASPREVGVDWGTSSEAYLQAVALFSQRPNILNGGGNLIIAEMNSEILEVAVARIAALIFFVGVLTTEEGADVTAQELTATVIQAMGDKMWIFPQKDVSAIAGIFTTIKDASLDKTRCLLYSEGDDDQKARIMGAAYAGGAFSTNFSASNSTSTRNLKTLIGITPDSTITQTIHDNAETAGVDLYSSFAGAPSVISNGANLYFDRVYNLVWLVSALQVAGFNSLATVTTKVPQTEPGMDLLKGALRTVMELSVFNSFTAPGQWNSSEWFGNQEDFDKNILQVGFYIFSSPVTSQSQADRNNRIAPTIQIAAKEAGAIHSAIINILIEA